MIDLLFLSQTSNHFAPLIGKNIAERLKMRLGFVIIALSLLVSLSADAQRAPVTARWVDNAYPALNIVEPQLAFTHGHIMATGKYSQDDVDSVVLSIPVSGGEWKEVTRLPGLVLSMTFEPESQRLWLLTAPVENEESGATGVIHIVYINGQEVISATSLHLPFSPIQGSVALYRGNLYLGAASIKSGNTTIHFGYVATVDGARGSFTWNELPLWDEHSQELYALDVIDNHLYLLAANNGEQATSLSFFLWDTLTGWQTLQAPGMTEQPITFLPFGTNHGLLVAKTGPWWLYHRITRTWVAMEENYTYKHLQTCSATSDGFLFLHGDESGYQSSVMIPVTRRGSLNWLDYGAIVLYFSVLVGMGIFFSRREVNTTAFFLGNRRVPWWAVGLSIFGTALSPITYLSIPARAFAADWVFLLAYAGIVLMGPIVVFFYLPHFRRIPISTAYEYLELRFNWATRLYGSICFMLYQGVRVSFMLFLPAITLSAVTGLDIYLCIGAMGILATLYTVMGGIEAVIWTDVLQTIVLSTGLFLALIIVVMRVDGGLPVLFSTAQDADKFHMINLGWGATTATLWVVLIGNLFSSFYPQTADQTIVQRYLTTATEKEAARAVWLNALMHIPLPILFFGLGTALWVYFKGHPENLDPTLQNDAVLPLFIIAEFPLGLRGIIIAGIFAAAMSSLDSSVNSVASVLINDYYRRWFPDITERRALIAARIISLLFGIFGTIAAMYVARLNALSLWDPFLEFLGLVGSGLAGVVALGVFTKRANGAGALTGAIASALVLLWVRQTSIHFFLYAAIGFITAFIIGWSASFFFTDNTKIQQDES